MNESTPGAQQGTTPPFDLQEAAAGAKTRPYEVFSVCFSCEEEAEVIYGSFRRRQTRDV